jgi:hypothetical protein
MLKNKTEKTWVLEKEKKQANICKCSKPSLISQTCNSLNPRS